jgi:hypothetical protein
MRNSNRSTRTPPADQPLTRLDQPLSAPAIAAVLVYRLITCWHPIVGGAVAYQVLQREGRLSDELREKPPRGSVRRHSARRPVAVLSF